jgi:hypothetical protein
MMLKSLFFLALFSSVVASQATILAGVVAVRESAAGEGDGAFVAWLACLLFVGGVSCA